jgi:hypothetical protein
MKVEMGEQDGIGKNCCLCYILALANPGMYALSFNLCYQI